MRFFTSDRQNDDALDYLSYRHCVKWNDDGCIWWFNACPIIYIKRSRKVRSVAIRSGQLGCIDLASQMHAKAHIY